MYRFLRSLARPGAAGEVRPSTCALVLLRCSRTPLSDGRWKESSRVPASLGVARASQIAAFTFAVVITFRRMGALPRLARPVLLLLLSNCVPAPVPGAPAPAGVGHPALAEIEREVHDRIDSHRSSRGLPRLQLDSALTSLARDHSERMARGQRPFGHTGFEERARAARAARQVSIVSENVASNNYPDEQVARRALAGWLRSPGHREKLEGDFDLTGIGVARGAAGDYFITQLFAATAPR